MTSPIENEGKTGGTVWVCEHGHIDHLHKSSALDLCSTCRDGICEPRKTLGRRSKTQRERDKEQGIHEPRRRSEPVKRRSPSIVRVLRPGDDPITVEAEALATSSTTPPFKLSRADRTAILAARHGSALPEITFPKAPPPDFPATSIWPASPGDVLEITSSVRLIVRGRNFQKARISLHYEIEDLRPELGARLTASKGAEKPADRLGGPEFGRQQEGVAVSSPKITREVHLAELRRHEKTRDDLGEKLSEMLTDPRDIRRPLQVTIDGLERRIGFLRGELGIGA